VGDPFGIELAQLLANFSASVKLLISGQRAILRDIWPSVGKQLSEFEQGEYTAKRLAVFEADEAKLLVELRNYSQHKFLPYLNPAWQFSQSMPMAEFQFRLHVEPLLKWNSLNDSVRRRCPSTPLIVWRVCKGCYPRSPLSRVVVLVMWWVRGGRQEDRRPCGG
jgi:hypothetical protein